MKHFDWNEEKNQWLKKNRGVGFEDVVALLDHNLLDIVEHSNQSSHPNQRVIVIVIGNYVYLVPFIEDKERVFLKTIFPSRKATKKYLNKK